MREMIISIIGENGEELYRLLFIFLFGVLSAMAALGVGIGAYLGSKKMMCINTLWENLTTKAKPKGEKENAQDKPVRVSSPTNKNKPDVQPPEKRKNKYTVMNPEQQKDEYDFDDNEDCYSYCQYYAIHGKCFEDCEMDTNKKKKQDDINHKGQLEFDDIEKQMNECTAHTGEFKDANVYCKVFSKVGMCYSDCPMALK